MVENCMVCTGSGRSITPPDFPTCQACNGTGKVIIDTCTVCNGSGGKVPDGIGNTRRVPCWACDGSGYKRFGF